MEPRIPIFPVRERNDFPNGMAVCVIDPHSQIPKFGKVSSSDREKPIRIYVEFEGVVEHDELDIDSPFLITRENMIWLRKIIQRYKDVASRDDKQRGYLEHIRISARSGNPEALVWMSWYQAVIRQVSNTITNEIAHKAAISKILGWIQEKR